MDTVRDIPDRYTARQAAHLQGHARYLVTAAAELREDILRLVEGNWAARHSEMLQPNSLRNHRENALRAENPSKSAIDASRRSRLAT